MRYSLVYALLAGAVVLSGCGSDGMVSRAVSGAAKSSEGSIREAMLSSAEPAQAVAYFSAQVDADPGDVDAQRGLAASLVKAGRASEGVSAWRAVLDMDGAGNPDLVSLADAQVRASDWTGAKATLDSVPPAHETFKRYRLEAMIADSLQQWNKADTYYEIAAELTTTPASVLNNWGYSKLSRGDGASAEAMFGRALKHDPDLFTAKNNLVLARATRGIWDLPAITMSEEERAQLLHTAGLAAVKRGETTIGRRLLEEAVAAHPRHFDAAQRALDALA